MNEFVYEQSAIADREHKAASEVLSAAENDAQAIEQRISEKSAARARMITDVRNGDLEESTAALRFAILDEDVRDLQALWNEAMLRVAAAEARVEQTGQAVRAATEAVAVYERGVTAQALDSQILDLERKLLCALVERYRVSGKRDNSLWSLWAPSPALRTAVTGYCLPQL